MIARKKSLAQYHREKLLREGKPLFSPRKPQEWPRREPAVGRHPSPKGQKQASQRPKASLKRQSAKARALIPARNACRNAVRARSGGRCEAQIDGVCVGRASDVHEIKARSAGGSITDPENCMDLCRPCHDWINEHANAARSLGFVAPRGA